MEEMTFQQRHKSHEEEDRFEGRLHIRREERLEAARAVGGAGGAGAEDSQGSE